MIAQYDLLVPNPYLPWYDEPSPFEDMSNSWDEDIEFADELSIAGGRVQGWILSILSP